MSPTDNGRLQPKQYGQQCKSQTVSRPDPCPQITFRGAIILCTFGESLITTHRPPSNRNVTEGGVDGDDVVTGGDKAKSISPLPPLLLGLGTQNTF